MKTKLLPLLPYSNYSLKAIEENEKKTAWLRVAKREDFKSHRFTIIKNTSIDNPVNWSESWFANYE